MTNTDHLLVRVLSYAVKIGEAQVSYNYHIAFNFAKWILARHEEHAFLTLDNRTLGDTYTPPFINLSEFSRVDLSLFINAIINYLSPHSSSYYYYLIERFPDV